jgi:tetratricopeptide (TPR) repeat protein
VSHAAGNTSAFYQQDISIPSGLFLLQRLSSIWEAQEGKMGRKTCSTEKARVRRSGVSTPLPVSLEEASRLHERAVALREQGQHAEAEALYRRALDTFSRLYGPDHYEIAVNSNNLAALLHARGQHAEAEPLYQRALAIKEHLLGPEHPDVAMTLSNLAVLYKSQGRYADAEALYQRALPLFEQALGPTHPHVETCLRNYARLLRDMQRRTEARDLEARARQVRQSRRTNK